MCRAGVEVQGILRYDPQNVEVDHEPWETVDPVTLVLGLLQSYPCAPLGPWGGTPSRSPPLAADGSLGMQNSPLQAGSEQGTKCHRDIL